MQDYIIVFEKPNGEIFERKRKSYPLERVGDKNNYGWTVLAVKFPYNGKYTTRDEYMKMIKYDQEIIKKKFQIKKWCYENIIKAFRIIVALALIQYIISK